MSLHVVLSIKDFTKIKNLIASGSPWEQIAGGFDNHHGVANLRTIFGFMKRLEGSYQRFTQFMREVDSISELLALPIGQLRDTLLQRGNLTWRNLCEAEAVARLLKQDAAAANPDGGANDVSEGSAWTPVEEDQAHALRQLIRLLDPQTAPQTAVGSQ